MSTKPFVRSTFCAMALLSYSAWLGAQMTVTGTIAGVALDPTGRVVAGARVTAVSEKNRRFALPQPMNPAPSASSRSTLTSIR
jgi:hypothetical protein